MTIVTLDKLFRHLNSDGMEKEQNAIKFTSEFFIFLGSVSKEDLVGRFFRWRHSNAVRGHS